MVVITITYIDRLSFSTPRSVEKMLVRNVTATLLIPKA